METTYEIRAAEPDDFQPLMNLYRQLQPDDPVLSNGRDRDVFLEIVAAPNLHIHLLVERGTVLATTYLNIIPNITRGASPYAVIENVITEESRRRGGLGRVLMAYTLSFAWERGCYKAMLQTGSRKESTHAFYRSCGFDGNDKHAYVARPNHR